MIRYFAGHPTAANLLMLGFLILGAISLPQLQRETFPDFTASELEVSVVWPGASAEDVEEALTRRIEDALDTVTDVAEIRSDAYEGRAVVTVEMAEGGDFGDFLSDVKTEIDAIDEFPEEAEDPVIRRLSLTDPVVAVAVSGELGPVALKAYCEELKDRLNRIDELAQVEILGFSDHQIQIRPSAERMMQYGLSVEDLSRVVQSQSVDLPLGTVETREQELLLRFADERRGPEEFERLVVAAGARGGEIRLGDVAEVVDRFEDPEDKILFQLPGMDAPARAALLMVSKSKRQDALEAMAALEEFLRRERGRAAEAGLTLSLTQDTTTIVRDRIALTVKNGWQGMLLVFAVMWLFFTLRFSFWVVMGLPVSFFGALFFMNVIGYSINMMTLVGLLMAIGLLMDDAIVISENIAARLEGGDPPGEAAIRGTREVLPGVLSSFLTTVSVFGPLAFISGDIGKVMRVMPVVLMLVLAVSLVEAFWILPHHLTHALRHGAGRERGRFRRGFEQKLALMRERVVGRAADWAVGHRYLFFGFVVMLFLITLSLLAGGRIKRIAFPELDGDVIVSRVLLPQGTPLARTEAVVARVTEALERVNRRYTPEQPPPPGKDAGHRPLVESVVVQFGVNTEAREQGPHVATITATLLSSDLRTGRVDTFLRTWREETGRPADVLELQFTELQVGPAGRALEIRFQGEDLEGLRRAAARAGQWFRSFEGVYDVSQDLRPGKPELRIRLREGARDLGLDAATLAGQLRSAFYGRMAQEIQVGPESYEINILLAPESRDHVEDLHEFRVTLPSGEQAPLPVVARIGEGRGWARISRVDGLRTVTLTGEVDQERSNSTQLIKMFQRRLAPELAGQLREELGRPFDLRISYEGATGEGAETGRSIVRAFGLGLVGVFLLLCFQFRSYLEPLIVMAVIPFALVGVVWGHLLMGLDLSMPSIVGFVSLAGIVVNDSILLVFFIKKNRAQGLRVVDAAPQASRERFRAVLLTSATTIVGLLPLLTEQSLQAQVLIPLATSVVFGLMASTLLVLFVIPALYAILADFGLARDVAVEEGEAGDERTGP